MDLPYLFTSGLFVVIIFLIGLFYTWEEARAMENKPKKHSPYEEKEDPKVVDD
ncbi:MAG: hypothetical protein WEA56_00295 [Balneolaceae bacterium]